MYLHFPDTIVIIPETIFIFLYLQVWGLLWFPAKINVSVTRKTTKIFQCDNSISSLCLDQVIYLKFTKNENKLTLVIDLIIRLYIQSYYINKFKALNRDLVNLKSVLLFIKYFVKEIIDCSFNLNILWGDDL